MIKFHLPDLGEGLLEADLIEWHVNEGDTVQEDQPLVSMETAKAVVDVPSPVTGVVKKLYGQAGDTLATGSLLAEFEGEANAEPSDTGTVAGTLEVGSTVVEDNAVAISNDVPAAGCKRPKVVPAVRALAKKLKVNLNTVVATGTDGTITKADVEKAAAQLQSLGPLEPLKGVSRTMAQVMAKSHADVVPATLCEDIILPDPTAIDLSVTMIQAIAKACQSEPKLNAWFDGEAMGRRLLTEINLAIAVDTSEGLFVPVIKNIDQKSAEVLRAELNHLREQAAKRTLTLEQFEGGGFALSNFGKFTGRYATPVVMPPMVGILGMGRCRETVIPKDGKCCTTATLLPVSLTFDHRACTGSEAARFLQVVVDFFQKV